MNARDIVLCSPVRTAIGAYNGSLICVRRGDGLRLTSESLRTVSGTA